MSSLMFSQTHSSSSQVELAVQALETIPLFVSSFECILLTCSTPVFDSAVVIHAFEQHLRRTHLRRTFSLHDRLALVVILGGLS